MLGLFTAECGLIVRQGNYEIEWSSSTKIVISYNVFLRYHYWKDPQFQPEEKKGGHDGDRENCSILLNIDRVDKRVKSWRSGSGYWDRIFPVPLSLQCSKIERTANIRNAIRKRLKKGRVVCEASPAPLPLLPLGSNKRMRKKEILQSGIRGWVSETG